MQTQLAPSVGGYKRLGKVPTSQTRISACRFSAKSWQANSQPNAAGTGCSSSNSNSGRRSASCMHWNGAILQRCSRHVSAADAGSTAAISSDDVVRVATIGDIVTLHFVLVDEAGQVLESSREMKEPIFFEVGAGDLMGNQLFQGFDEAIRGLAVGQTTVIEATGGNWNPDLMFTVPRDHPEVARLEGRYKNHGGLKKELVVELANGKMASVMEVTDDYVKMDANNMIAGKTLSFELEVVSIEKPTLPKVEEPKA